MSIENTEPLPVLPHLAAEFYSWIWWKSEATGGQFDLDEPLTDVEVWMDERLAFRRPGDTKVSAVLTGDDASTTLESRAALAGGKVLEEIRLRIRREEREFTVSLKGATIGISRARLPQVAHEAEDTALYDRMFLYEELNLIVQALFQKFSDQRVGEDWEDVVLPGLSEWVRGGEAE